MKMFKLLILIPFILLMCGCWNYTELNNMSIVTGLSIDKDSDEYKIGLLIANSKKSESSTKEGEAQTIVYSGKGKTISEALKDIDLVSHKRIYLGHLAVIIVSEDIAKDGMEKMLDFLLRYPESIKRFYLAVSKDDKAIDILKIVTPLQSFPSQTIYLNIKSSSHSQAITTAIPYSTFINNLLMKGKNPILPTITIKGDPKKGSESQSLEKSTPSAELKLDTVAIFKNDKLVDFATDDESRGINLVQGNINEMIVSAKCDNGSAIANLNDLKTSMKVNKNNVSISIKGGASLQEVTCNINLNEAKEMYELKKKIEDKLKTLINKGIDIAQKNKSDIFGFGNLAYKKDPKYYDKIKDIWHEEIFPKIKPKININIDLKARGSIKNTIMEDTNE